MCFLLLSYTVMAQKADEVTLVASGSASTEQEATLVALRSAIEQTFGTFVSSNTTMVNDELIKDEIVSISNGNVKNYEKLSSNVLSNGHVSVSVKATICISKLISYAKSKGSSAEFAGQTFAINKKMQRLREENFKKAYTDMCDEIQMMLEDAFNFSIHLSDKTGEGKDGVVLIPATISILGNQTTAKIYKLYTTTNKFFEKFSKDKVYGRGKFKWASEETNAYIVECDKALTDAAVKAMFDYKIRDNNNICNLEWSDRRDYLQMHRNDLYGSKVGVSIRITNNFWNGSTPSANLSLIDKNKGVITRMYMYQCWPNVLKIPIWSGNRIIDVREEHLYRWDSIDTLPTWQNWSKFKSNKAILQYEIPIYITADEMSNFQGVTIERKH